MPIPAGKLAREPIDDRIPFPLGRKNHPFPRRIGAIIPSMTLVRRPGALGGALGPRETPPCLGMDRGDSVWKGARCFVCMAIH